MNHLHVKKGDVVKVLTGKDRGKEGEVLVVHPKENRVVVEGVNKASKHIRGKGIVEIVRPLHASNVAKISSKKAEKPKKVSKKSVKKAK